MRGIIAACFTLLLVSPIGAQDQGSAAAPGSIVGPQGPAGPQGATGMQGPQGAAGPAGVAGAKGDIGPAGAAGTKGDTGAAGPQGPSFAQYATEVPSTANCGFTVVLPAGRFTSPPVVTATAIKSGGRDYVVTVTSKSALTIVGQVRASRTLPAVIGLLTVLAGYDTLTCTSTDLTPVDIIATQAVP